MRHFVILFMATMLGCTSLQYLSCPKCISVASEIELIDAVTAKHIIDPQIIVQREGGQTDTLISERTGSIGAAKRYLIGDSTIQVVGGPGKYSFHIKRDGYKDVILNNILVGLSGNPKCNMAAPERLRISLKDDEGSSGSDISNTIMMRQTGEHCR